MIAAASQQRVLRDSPSTWCPDLSRMADQEDVSREFAVPTCTALHARLLSSLPDMKWSEEIYGAVRERRSRFEPVRW